MVVKPLLHATDGSFLARALMMMYTITVLFPVKWKVSYLCSRLIINVLCAAVTQLSENFRLFGEVCGSAWKIPTSYSLNGYWKWARRQTGWHWLFTDRKTSSEQMKWATAQLNCHCLQAFHTYCQAWVFKQHSVSNAICPLAVVSTVASGTKDRWWQKMSEIFV